MLQESDTFLITPLEHQNIVWFKVSNTYVITEKLTTELLIQINQNKSENDLIKWCKQSLGLHKSQSLVLINKTKALYTQQTTPKASKPSANIQKVLKPFQIIYYYKIACVIFKVSFENEALAYLIHPIGIIVVS